ncbi:hypothetical protein BS47DRAFT_1299907 [Hydnum rufescens UP504]|uniref:Arrestin-like N-terminal domain-containing protein n=1 Tax=Hydnum rufescens UP504 TaxID=1448309 RepID=A0A9P6DTK6_9AGAM|nr:hypothetical protein BS47DRAFT_1299907 [Hydnum rufescens UP504]
MSQLPVSSSPGSDHSGRAPAPSYHSSLGIGPTPSYTRNVRPTEEVIARGAATRRLNGVYNKPGKLVSVSLNGQEPNCTLPMFGRGVLVEGIVTLDAEAARNALQLDITIEGDMKLLIAEGGTITHPLLSVSIPLFYSTTPTTCSETHPFSCRLPTRFDDSGTQRPLPPTYEVNFPGVPGIRAAVRYWMTVRLVRKKIWRRKELVTVPFKYYPRARPPQPIVGLSFLSSIKSHPEEWSSFTSTIAPRNPRSNARITSSFVLPSTAVFPMSRKIPFHLQLSLDPPPSSLTPETNPEPASPTKQSTPAPAPTLISSLLTSQAVVKVTLQRQISVDVRNQRVLKSVVCGEGYMHRVRLSSNSSTNGESSGSTSSSQMSQQDWAGWEGEVIPSKQINVGGFRAAGLTIRDFIMLTLIPPNPQTSPLRAHQHAVPVRIVTDAWEGDEEALGTLGN